MMKRLTIQDYSKLYKQKQKRKQRMRLVIKKGERMQVS